MLIIFVGKGRNRRKLEFPNLNRRQLHYMTERTQVEMFGEVVARRSSDQSIHPHGRSERYRYINRITRSAKAAERAARRAEMSTSKKSKRAA